MRIQWADCLIELPEGGTGTDQPVVAAVTEQDVFRQALAAVLGELTPPPCGLPEEDGGTDAEQTPPDDADAAPVACANPSWVPDEVLASLAAQTTAVEAIPGLAEVQVAPETEPTAQPEPVATNPGPRRVQGIRLPAETFPEGWEVLLQDNPDPAWSSDAESPAQDLPVRTTPETSAAEPELPFIQETAPRSTQDRARPEESVPRTAEPISTARSEEAAATPRSATVADKAPAVDLPAPAQRPAVSTPAQVIARLEPAQKDAVVTSFAQAAAPGIAQRRERLTVDLHPPDLGRVRVMVEHRGEMIHARLTLQDQSLGEFFQDRQGLLRRTLEEAGIKLGSLSVDIQQQFPQDQDTGRDDTPSWSSATAGTDWSDAPTARWNRSGAWEGRVDVLI